MITTEQLREKFLDFFKEKGHVILPSASLVPENDSSTLFISAGMQPLVPYLMGEPHPQGTKLADVQKCVRTGDIDEVGDAWHLTFFEMLGNWSLGDYWKKESLTWTWEFLTSPEWLGLDPKKLAVSVFAGNDTCPQDKESVEIWKSLGVPEERIAYLGVDDNWWPTGGKSTGPQGPDSEVFFWSSDDPVPDEFDPSDDRWTEIWNNVFMEYNRTSDGNLEPLKQKNVDTGMGLERTVAVLNNFKSVYETDAFDFIIDFLKEKFDLEELSSEDIRAVRVIADHLRASVFILGDDAGVVPSNVARGYILRRLIRRSIRYGRRYTQDKFVGSVAEIIIKRYSRVYEEIDRNKNKILSELDKEEDKFRKTLSTGLKVFKKIIIQPEVQESGMIDGQKTFDLFSTFGFPLEIVKDLARENSLRVDEEGFEKEFKRHQEKSRTASKGMFKGGLVDHSPQVIKMHTATHLLQQALRDVLGDHIHQKGSRITHEKLTFDFPHSEKLSDEEIKKVEDIVNEKILQDLPVHYEIMTPQEAKKSGAIGVFDERYDKQVKVYFIGDYSKEICGGPHVKSTKEVGKFKILKEKSVGSGIRRIEATVE